MKFINPQALSSALASLVHYSPGLQVYRSHIVTIYNYYVKLIFIAYNVSRMILKGEILGGVCHFIGDPYLNCIHQYDTPCFIVYRL